MFLENRKKKKKTRMTLKKLVRILPLSCSSLASARSLCRRAVHNPNKALFLTSAAGFLREKVRKASFGVEKEDAAWAAAAVAAFCFARGGAALLFSLLLPVVTSDSAESAATAAAARPRRGGMVVRTDTLERGEEDSSSQEKQRRRFEE